MIEGEWQLSAGVGDASGVPVYRRYRLIGTGPVVASVSGGEAWLVRDGNLVLVGSRMEPEWTDLPPESRERILMNLSRLLERRLRMHTLTAAQKGGEDEPQRPLS